MTAKFLLDYESDKSMAGLNTKEIDENNDKDLSAAMDSFDNLFCRRCLVSTQAHSILFFCLFFVVVSINYTLFCLVCRFVLHRIMCKASP